MSKQSDAKKAQNYRDEPVFPVCGNCKHLKREFVTDHGWTKETAVRCGLGGFKPKKLGSCDRHEFKEGTTR